MENRKALLDQIIEQKKITIPGYWDSYITIWGKFEEYGSTLCYESKELNMTEGDRDHWTDQKYNNTIDEIQTNLLENLTWKK